MPGEGGAGSSLTQGGALSTTWGKCREVLGARIGVRAECTFLGSFLQFGLEQITPLLPLHLTSFIYDTGRRPPAR